MDSVMRHLLYLAPDIVVFCLFDPEPVMWRRERWPGQCSHSPSSHHTAWKTTHACADATNPSLASFVRTDSWKLWELLGVGHAWLQPTVHWWSRSNDYNVAEQFVQGLTVVNDGAERCVHASLILPRQPVTPSIKRTFSWLEILTEKCFKTCKRQPLPG